MKNVRGVTRIDQPENGTAGWFVRVGWKGKTPLRVAYFADKKWGGKEIAYEAACKRARGWHLKLKRETEGEAQ